MASQSRDKSRDDCVHSNSGSGEPAPEARDKAEAEGAHPPHASGVTAADAIPGPAGDASKLEDQGLIEMLEQLNETLDSAQFVLNEHQMLATEIACTEPEMAAAPAAEPANSALTPLLAAGLGVCIGIVGLALFWPLWKPSPGPDPGRISSPAETGMHETRIGRSVQTAPSAGDSIAQTELPGAAPRARKTPDRLPLQPTKIEAALTASSQPPAMPDKLDFEAKDETMPAAQPEQAVAAAVEGKPARQPLSAEEANGLIEKGNAFLAQSDVASARLIFEHIASRGNADAMFDLARTYDPHFLKQYGAVGIKPDIRAALDWYERAARNGHDQAGAMARELETAANHAE